MGSDGRVRTLAFLEATAGGCVRCPLAAARTRVVFGSGSAHASLMVVGEAPGADEDASGLPFVGDAGRVLDALLLEAGFPRADTYVANTVKCRPPGNRPPTGAEVAACAPFLDLQIAAVRPRVILTLGATAARRLVGGSRSLRESRGRAYTIDGGALVTPTYHPSPSALNRDPERRSLLREDLQSIRRLLANGL